MNDFREREKQANDYEEKRQPKIMVMFLNQQLTIEAYDFFGMSS